MCGIIGYTGNLNASEVLLDGLARLEYRGYDSAGIAIFNNSEAKQPVHLLKRTGKVAALKEAWDETNTLSHCGIGHTRWATHGGVTEENAHPHQGSMVTLIHNGIVENYQALAADYSLNGQLLSETDTEVAAKVLDYYYKENHFDPLTSIAAFVDKLEGSYAFCILFSDRPGEIYGIRNISPLVAAYTPSGAVVASDLTALLPYGRSYMVVPENRILYMTENFIKVYDFNGRVENVEYLEVTWNLEDAKKNGFAHFMLKEIHEQPEAIRNTISPRIHNGLPDFSEDKIPDTFLAGWDKIHIVACGTAMHAGMVAKSLYEQLLRLPVSVSIASEFRYENPLIDDKTLVILISQSGETIDTLAALTLAKDQGAKTLSIVNVKGSTIARESDYVLYTHAGPEIAVASTKAYTVQLSLLYLLGCKLALLREKFDIKTGREFITALKTCAKAIEVILKQQETIKDITTHFSDAQHAFFIGRGLDYASSLEGALKLKEISYIHAEAYAAGELKHGTIALVEEATPVIALATQSHVYGKTISNIREVKARGAFVMLFAKAGMEVTEDICDIFIPLPELDDKFIVFPVTVALQLLAYYVADGKGLNVDQPRNLAKSVTVE